MATADCIGLTIKMSRHTLLSPVPCTLVRGRVRPILSAGSLHSRGGTQLHSCREQMHVSCRPQLHRLLCTPHMYTHFFINGFLLTRLYCGVCFLSLPLPLPFYIIYLIFGFLPLFLTPTWLSLLNNHSTSLGIPIPHPSLFP